MNDSEFASQLGVTAPAFRIHADGRRDDFDMTVVVPRDTDIPAVIPPRRVSCFRRCCSPARPA